MVGRIVLQQFRALSVGEGSLAVCAEWHKSGFQRGVCNRERARKPIGRYASAMIRFSSTQEEHVEKQHRGFAAMDQRKQRLIASKGGRTAHERGTAHKWTTEEARAAGRKGGAAFHHQAGRSPEGASDVE
jgi:general stress protein YciG